MGSTKLRRAIEAPTRLRRAVEAVKDQLSIGLAKVHFQAQLSSVLHVAIVKATKHDEYPADERNIEIILNLTCHSSNYVRSCVKTISRRVRKTDTWTVALKALMLVHRLIHDGNAAFQKAFFTSTRYGTCLFDMSNFLDKTRLYSWDYSSFVRAYALYLDNQLEQKVKPRKGRHVSVSTPKAKEKPGAIIVKVEPVQEMKMGRIFTRISGLMKTLDLFLNCRPTGSAKTNRVVLVALYPVIKESFVLYDAITETIVVLIRRFIELDIPESIKVHKILCRVSKQLDELDTFYKWSMSYGIARDTRYPEVVNIPQMKLDKIEKYIRKKQAAEENMNSIKALPPMIEMKIHKVGHLINLDNDGSRSEEKEIDMKIHEVGDFINLDVDDPPTTEENPDKLALSIFDGASTTVPSEWETFSDSVDWETELDYSAISLFNQNETPTGGFDTLRLDYGMHRHRAVNSEEGSSSNVGVPTMLALPAPPSHNDNAHTTMFYPNFATPMIITPPPHVQMSEMEMKQRLPTEQQVMWQQSTTDVMQGPVVACTVIQPHSYMYNQGGYTKTH